MSSGKAVKLYHRAAELESSGACRFLGTMYLHGDNVSKDEIKLRYYFELAAMAGCVVSRFSLFYDEFEDKRFDRAIKHLLIRSSCEFIVAVLK